MTYVILVTDLVKPTQVVGPYRVRATAEARLETLHNAGLMASIFALTGDSAYFGKPVGNRTRH